MPPVSPNQRLPLLHPDYEYSEAKNPYAKKLLEFPDYAYTDRATENHRGEWREQFLISRETKHSKRRLHVEIGCNTGHVTRAWAERSPEDLFIGIDWKFKIIYRGAEKAAKLHLKNVIFLRANVERIEYLFGPGEIDRLHLYFPDPWPKKSQWKNRFLKESSLRKIAPLMARDGVFHIKTDHDGYFEAMKEAFEATKDVWNVEKITHDLHEGNPAPEKLEIPDVTLFEKLFIKDGIKIKSAWLRPLDPGEDL